MKSCLEDVAHILMGQSPPSSSYNDQQEGLPFLQGKAEFRTVFPAPVKWCSAPLRIAKKNSILVSVRAPVGDVNIADQDVCIGRGLAAITPKSSCVLEYLFYSLLERKAELQLEGRGSTFQSINKDVLNRFSMDLPPLPEQRAIASVLRTVQNARESCRRVIEATKQLKRSMMKHLFTYGPVSVEKVGEVDVKETEIGTINKRWNVCRLRDVAELVSGGTPSKSNSEYWSGTIPWASPKDLKRPRLFDVEDHISETGLANGSRLVPAGSLFVVVRGMILNRDIPVAMAMVPMALNQDLKAAIPNRQVVYPEYLLCAVTSMKHQLVKHIGTSAHGTKRLGTSTVADFQLPLPPLSEQKLISDMLHTIDRRLDSQQSCLLALDSLFKSLLHHLMSGSFRLPQFRGGPQ